MSVTPAITILIDNGCPLCRREGAMLRRLDGGQGRIGFVDIASPTFDASLYGRTHDEVMGAMHAVLPDGSIITGVEVFRRAYSAVGLGWLLAWTAWPGFRAIADWAYRIFARLRLRLTVTPHGCGDRCGMPAQIAKRKAKMAN